MQLLQCMFTDNYDSSFVFGYSKKVAQENCFLFVITQENENCFLFVITQEDCFLFVISMVCFTVLFS